MRSAVDQVLSRSGGVASRRRLLTTVPAAELDDEIRRGRLVRVYRRAYCRPWDADLPDTSVRAALVSVGSPVVLSHLSALHRWALTGPPALVHVSVPATRSVRPQAGIRLHRVSALPEFVRLHGLVTTALAAAVVESWPLLPAHERRGPAITACRDGRLDTAALAREVERRPRLAGRRDLRALLDALAAGCESELEIWGFRDVFTGPDFAGAVRQHPVVTAAGRFRLDLAFVAEKVAVELDGDRWHSSREQRERDRRRDAALAAVGWVTLRFSYDRLHRDSEGCRRELLATLARRR